VLHLHVSDILSGAYSNISRRRRLSSGVLAKSVPAGGRMSDFLLATTPAQSKRAGIADR